MFDHPQVEANHFAVDVNHRDLGNVRMAGPLVAFSDTPLEAGDLPALGEHTDAVLTDLGYPPDTIAQVARSGRVVAPMPEYVWDETKDDLLRRERHISFEDVKYHLTSGNLLDDIPNPDQERYPGQRLYIIGINRLAWVVPYRRTALYVFLYTAYPSRKFTRIYRRQLGGENESG